MMKSQWATGKLISRVRPWGWRRILALALICVMTPACSLNAAQIFIPLAYGSIGMCIALLVSPSLSAAIIGFAMGGIIGAAVYNNSLKSDLRERPDLTPESQPSR
ncbi:hypothetical protein [Desulfobacca acetoxidans]|uniref:Uncharacterized protein n=1 Tax=Desulfobacca acetoxidans (strain ATCC 700848 / DSM 11109 / ASRB2) TaxID=880072 RepID=F2NE46_DESAR|nr:hypothetical protein [Desulfobacca acetoxidans]AEB10676.1 hypothetical protein Desac_2876 [Desulfobacca acetoxidans DSM 11109]